MRTWFAGVWGCLLASALAACGAPPAKGPLGSELVMIGSIPLRVGQTSRHRVSGALTMGTAATGEAPSGTPANEYRSEWTERVVSIDGEKVNVVAQYAIDRSAEPAHASLAGHTLNIEIDPPRLRVSSDDESLLDEASAKDLARRHRDPAPFAAARPRAPVAVGASVPSYLTAIAADLGLGDLDGDVRMIAVSAREVSFAVAARERGEEPGARVDCRFSVQRSDGRLSTLSCTIKNLDPSDSSKSWSASLYEEIIWE